ncbi:MAG: DUF6485 family protein [Planctomycetaceae bacterium]|nr:DUF6485 family protein [Planctomycetaceae bacterium]
MNSSPFCTCSKLDCRLHPTNHDKGCAPCVSKNLQTKEMPSCFFNVLEGADSRPGDTFEDFADLVKKNKA